MKKILFLLLTAFSITVFAQTPKYLISQDIKLKKKYGSPSIIHSDNTGTYLATHVNKALGFIAFIPISFNVGSEMLLKLNDKLERVFMVDYDDEMKGKSFNQYFFHNDKIWLFATEYLKKEDTENLYCIEIDKNTGVVIGDWQLIKTWFKYNKKQNVNIEITPNADNTKYIISNYLNTDGSHQFEVSIHDKTFKPQGKSFNLKNEFDPAYVKISDLFFTKTNHIVLLAKVYEDVPFKRKTKRVFKENVVRVYDIKGKVLHKLNTAQENVYLYESKATEIDGVIYMVANYGASRDTKVTGTLVQTLNPETGQITTATNKSIDEKVIENNTSETDDPEEKKEIEKEKKEENKNKEENEDNSLSALWFKKYTRDNDGSSYTFSEDKNVVKYTRTREYTTAGFGNNRVVNYTSNNYTDILCKNIVINKIDNAGNTVWSVVIPKIQKETHLGWYNLADLDGLGNFQESKSYIPRYSSFFSFQTKNKIYIVFNDNMKNENVTQKSQPIKSAYGYGKKTNTYVVEVDKTTGALTRTTLFNNKELVPMVRGGKVFDKSVYFMSEEYSAFSKSEFKIIKLSMD
jgi:hypothetical protein